MVREIKLFEEEIKLFITSKILQKYFRNFFSYKSFVFLG